MRHLLALFCLPFLIMSCQQAPLTFSPSESFDADIMEGAWMSQGYGQVTEFSDGRIRNYSVTANTCVAEPDELSGIHFLNLVRYSPDKQTMRLSSTEDPYEYEYRKLSSLNEVCPKFSPNTPLGNFDAFADFFDTHYSFFDLYGVDWAKNKAEAREEISEQTSDQELFGIMKFSIKDLADSHIGLDAMINGEAVTYDANPGETENALLAYAKRNKLEENTVVNAFRRDYWLKDIQENLLNGKGVMTPNGRIQYGMVAESVGYLAVPMMGGFVDGELATLPDELTFLEPVLDEALTLFEENKANAVILDLSFNTGGYDFIGLAIADRFVKNNEISAFSKHAYDWPNGPDFDYKLGVDKNKKRFEGDLYIVTSDLTVSAGEMVPLSLRGLPHVKTVGQNTRGAFSTVLSKYLPNGWKVNLSNEIYNDREGQVWEGKGLPPDIEIQIFNRQDPNKGHVESVQMIIEMINEK